jgi:atypical dual specificity phosphatase
MTRGSKGRPPEHYWLEVGRLMGGEWPVPHFDWLASQGISMLVNLTERTYLDDRFQIHRIPLADGSAPDVEQIRQFCDVVERALDANSRVYVHCAAGCGRTGTMMACYLVYRHRLDPLEALHRVRTARPCSVETAAQAEAVIEWARHLQVNE